MDYLLVNSDCPHVIFGSTRTLGRWWHKMEAEQHSSEEEPFREYTHRHCHSTIRVVQLLWAPLPRGCRIPKNEQQRIIVLILLLLQFKLKLKEGKLPEWRLLIIQSIRTSQNPTLRILLTCQGYQYHQSGSPDCQAKIKGIISRENLIRKIRGVNNQ